MFCLQCSEEDLNILSHLKDVNAVDDLDEDDDEIGYTLTFTFDENEYFSNKKLTLQLFVYQADGMVRVQDAKGTKINWKSDAVNPTIKVMKKKKSGQSKKGPQVKKEKVASFFNIFEVPDIENIEELPEEEMEDAQAEVEQLLTLGEVLREQIIPRAVEWFTGEANEEEDLEEDEEYSEYSDDDEDDEDDDEEGGEGLKPVDAKDPGECKQQ